MNVQEINVGFIVKFVHITQERLLATGSGGRICIYKRSGVEYTQTQSIQTHESVIVGLTDYQNYEGFVFGGNSNTFSVYELADASYELTHQELIGKVVNEVIIDSDQLYLIVETGTSLITYYRCPPECQSCFFPNNCSACATGYTLTAGKCLPKNNQPSHCVKNEFTKDDICREYCARECETCDQTKHDCIECAALHQKNEEGKCEAVGSLSIFVSVRPFLNMMRRRGTKWVFMMVDDLWLYQYHQQEYDGTIRVVFQTISLI